MCLLIRPSVHPSIHSSCMCTWMYTPLQFKRVHIVISCFAGCVYYMHVSNILIHVWTCSTDPGLLAASSNPKAILSHPFVWRNGDDDDDDDAAADDDVELRCIVSFLPPLARLAAGQGWVKSGPVLVLPVNVTQKQNFRSLFLLRRHLPPMEWQEQDSKFKFWPQVERVVSSFWRMRTTLIPEKVDKKW